MTGGGNGAAPRDPAREEILGRVRAALRDVPTVERPQDVVVPRDYRRAILPDRGERVGRFVERLEDYGAHVRRAPLSRVADAVAEALGAHGARRVAVAPGYPEPWRPAGLELIVDDGLAPAQLDDADAALSGCALAIAETGTIALDGDRRSGRRALTLIPDLHVCVVEADQVVGGVPEAFASLEEAVRLGGRPVTLVSGPSATSDIELNRVEGVHGPRRLEVVLVG